MVILKNSSYELLSLKRWFISLLKNYRKEPLTFTINCSLIVSCLPFHLIYFSRQMKDDQWLIFLNDGRIKTWFFKMLQKCSQLLREKRLVLQSMGKSMTAPIYFKNFDKAFKKNRSIVLSKFLSQHPKLSIKLTATDLTSNTRSHSQSKYWPWNLVRENPI